MKQSWDQVRDLASAGSKRRRREAMTDSPITPGFIKLQDSNKKKLMSTTLTFSRDVSLHRTPVSLRDQSRSQVLAFERPTRPPEERAYYKALRKAELAAWHDTGGRIEVSANPFRHAKAEIERQRRRERWLFAIAGGIAAAALAISFEDTFRLLNHWVDFTRFVQQVVG